MVHSAIREKVDPDSRNGKSRRLAVDRLQSSLLRIPIGLYTDVLSSRTTQALLSTQIPSPTMIAATEIRLVLVTPETTLLDQNVRSVQLPLFDGSMGILPGRAPVVGRLGRGEVKFEVGGASKRFYIDGGFLQIKGSIVTLLTNKAVEADKIDAAAAQRALEAAQAMPATTDEQYAAKAAADDAARQMLRITGRA